MKHIERARATCTVVSLLALYQVADVGESSSPILADEAKHDAQPAVTLIDVTSLKDARRTYARCGEQREGTLVVGSLSDAGGTPWCNGRPTYWLLGHQPENEAPFCFDAHEKQWFPRYESSLDTIDKDDDNKQIDLRSNKKTPNLDRHDCVKLDVNGDNIDDIVCVLGAYKGMGGAYNELYFTSSVNNRLEKQRNHGLWKYLNMRTRFMVALKSPDSKGKKNLIFIATKAKERRDGKPNQHRMFRVVERPPYFEEIAGPWVDYGFIPVCVVAGDVNSDGIDDLIACGDTRRKNDGSRIYIQDHAGDWRAVSDRHLELSHANAHGWRNVRIVDINKDGLNDLAVVGEAKNGKHYLRIFKGIRSDADEPANGYAAPWIRFDQPVFEADLDYASPDLEFFDFNADGILDLYVVQVDESHGYCAGNADKSLWGLTPPRDTAPDLLFQGRGDFEFHDPIYMTHSLPGCGNIVERFGGGYAQALVLAQGTRSRPGYNVLLTWEGSKFHPRAADSSHSPGRELGVDCGK